MFLLTFLIAITYAAKVSAQLEDLKKTEVRFSLIGQAPKLPSFDDRLREQIILVDPTISFLRRIKNSSYFLRTDLSALYVNPLGTIVKVSFPDEEPNTFGGTLSYANFYIGIEKQKHFRHWGFFPSLGVHAGRLNYATEFEEISVLDFNNSRYRQGHIGLIGQISAYTNVTDKAFLFWSLSISGQYVRGRYIEKPTDNCCEDRNGWKAFYHPLEAIGLAIKF